MIACTCSAGAAHRGACGDRPLPRRHARSNLNGGSTPHHFVQQQGINSLDPLLENLEQLARLEALVETSKPLPQALGLGTPIHPLLSSPFR